MEPRMFVRASSSGRRTDTDTDTCAARWHTTSGRNSLNAAAGSAISSLKKGTPPGTCSRFPVERSSSAATWWPAARSDSTTWDPMNPAPPVTRQRTGRPLMTFSLQNRPYVQQRSPPRTFGRSLPRLHRLPPLPVPPGAHLLGPNLIGPARVEGQGLAGQEGQRVVGRLAEDRITGLEE